MRIWAVVFNPSYSMVVSNGPIFLQRASITRSLDKLTRLNAPIQGNDIRALQYITARNIVEIYVQPVTPSHMPAVAARMVGAFIIDNLSVNITKKSVTRSIQGTGVMLALKDKLTFPGLTYDNATIDTIFNGVNGLATLAGWTADVEAGISANQTSVRFDGTNTFKSMQTVTEIQGLHLRHTEGTVVEVSAFGTGNGYRLTYLEGDTGPDDYGNMPMLIESMEIVEEAGGEFYNAGLYYGAGQGDARLDLSKSTRLGITVFNDGARDHHMIEDAASIALYGRIERMVQIKKLAPVGTSAPQQINAANALFDGGYEHLQRHKQPIVRYKATVRNIPNANIQPGDKLQTVYDGVVHKDGLSAPYKWATINQEMWILSVTEDIGSDGVKLQLEISNVDAYLASAAEIIVGMVESIEINNIGVQPYPVQRFWQHKDPVDENNPVEFQFTIFDDVLDVVSVLAYIERRVWTAVAGTAAESGDHKHLVAEHITTTFHNPPVSVSAVTHVGNAVIAQAEYRYANDDDVLSSDTFDMNILVGDGSQGNWYTKGSSGGHTHPNEFTEVQKDVILPEDCSLVVNGTLVASGLFPTSGGDNFVMIDITEEVLSNPSGFRTRHDVAIDCATDKRGDLIVSIYIDCRVGTVRAS